MEPPTLQQLQKSFEEKYKCEFVSNPGQGQICVTYKGDSGNSLNREWFEYVQAEAKKYSDLPILITSDTNCTRISAWNTMYKTFYDDYIRTMPSRKSELLRLEEEKIARAWAAKRPPILDRDLINEYRWYNTKTEKIFKIKKLYPSYSNEKIESILHYLDSPKSKYVKNTLLAVKALNRFAREHEIDINSALVVWKEHL